MNKWLVRWGSVVIASVLFGCALLEMVFGHASSDYALAVYLTILALMLLAYTHLLGRAFRRGWLAGRHAMLNSMAEATRRRMGLIDWVEAEMERDGFVVVHEEMED